MTRSTARIVLRILGRLSLLFVLGASLACTVPVAKAPPVEDEIIVKLVPARGPGGYGHPASLSPQELAVLMEGIRVQYDSHWLQNLITGRLEPLPLFKEPILARLVPLVTRALEQATPRDRIVFYVAERKSDVRRVVTSGSLFIRDGLLQVVVASYRTDVDVIPGVPPYDRTNPEMAVVPQRFILAFDPPEFAVHAQPQYLYEVFGAPVLIVDYKQFLTVEARKAEALVRPGAPMPSRVH